MDKVTKLEKYSPIVIPRNKRYGNNLWLSRGLKVASREIVLYSDLEFDHWLKVESDPLVKTYCEQPLKISYVLNSKLHISIFDMWILYLDGTESMVEVKYENELKPGHRNFQRNTRQIEAQREWCRERGISHEVRTEKTIRAGRHTVENHLKMVSNITNNPKPISSNKVYDCISAVKMPLSHITKLLENELKPYEIILAVQWLCYEGIISADMSNSPWGLNTEVWINE